MKKEYILKVLYKSSGIDILSVGERADIVLYNLKFLKINYDITDWRHNGEGYYEKFYNAKPVDHDLTREEIQSIGKSLEQEGFKLKLGDLEDIVS